MKRGKSGFSVNITLILVIALIVFSIMIFYNSYLRYTAFSFYMDEKILPLDSSCFYGCQEDFFYFCSKGKIMKGTFTKISSSGTDYKEQFLETAVEDCYSKGRVCKEGEDGYSVKCICDETPYLYQVSFNPDSCTSSECSYAGSLTVRVGLQKRVDSGKRIFSKNGMIMRMYIDSRYKENTFFWKYKSNEEFQALLKKYIEKVMDLKVNKKLTITITGKIAPKIINSEIIGKVGCLAEQAYQDVDAEIANELNKVVGELLRNQNPEQRNGPLWELVKPRLYDENGNIKQLTPDEARKLTADISKILELGVGFLPETIKIPKRLQEEYGLKECVHREVLRALLILNNEREEIKKIADFFDQQVSFSQGSTVTIDLTNGKGKISVGRKVLPISGKLANAMINLMINRDPSILYTDSVRIRGHIDVQNQACER